jgi:hypothetical protein
MLYTEPRYTKDLDVWIDATAENGERVYRSLLAFGAPLAGLTAKDFAAEGSFYQMGIPPMPSNGSTQPWRRSVRRTYLLCERASVTASR